MYGDHAQFLALIIDDQDFADADSVVDTKVFSYALPPLGL
jgi:hypothetical protein